MPSTRRDDEDIQAVDETTHVDDTRIEDNATQVAVNDRIRTVGETMTLESLGTDEPSGETARKNLALKFEDIRIAAEAQA